MRIPISAMSKFGLMHEFLYLQVLSFLLSGVNSQCQPSITTVAGQQACSGQIIINDQFETLDKSKWKHTIRISGPQEQEFVTYTESPKNSYTRDGILYIKPTLLDKEFVKSGSINLDRCTGQPGSDDCKWTSNFYSIMPPIESAELNLIPLSFKYGVVEIRAKMASGDWIVPFILLRCQADVFGKSNSTGTIVLAKSHGNADIKSPSKNNLDKKSAVFGVKGEYLGREGNAFVTWKSTEGWDENFHTYRLEWTPGHLVFQVDSLSKYHIRILNDPQKMFQIVNDKTPVSGNSLPPFEEQFFLSLGVFVGGMKEFPDDVINNGRPKPWKNINAPKARGTFWRDRANWNNTWNNEYSALQIDYVKITAI